MMVPDPDLTDAAPGPRLSGLTIGALSLSPAFDPDVTEYLVTTSNATNKITATSEGGTIAIKLNGEAHENGTSASWSVGSNTVIVTVTDGDAETAYTISVIKS